MISFRSRRYTLISAGIAGIACVLWFLANPSINERGGRASSLGQDERSSSAAASAEASVVAESGSREEAEAVSPTSRLAILPTLPALEARFMSDRQVRFETLRDSLTTDRFEKDYQSLENAMTQSADAVALRDVYREALGRQIADAGLGNATARLACGQNMCLGSLRVAGKDDRYGAWWKDFTSSAQTPHGTAFDFPYARADGSIEHRFFFSTDPNANVVRSIPGT
ncbi:MAG: hypothetical protein V4673_17230 [Pseudomonadota bacterium]